MSGSFNKFIGLGNLTRDPELRYIPSGAPVCTFDLAFNRTYTTQDGQKKDEVCFMPIVVWGKQAESCGQYLSKGRQALGRGSPAAAQLGDPGRPEAHQGGDCRRARAVRRRQRQQGAGSARSRGDRSAGSLRARRGPVLVPLLAHHRNARESPLAFRVRCPAPATIRFLLLRTAPLPSHQRTGSTRWRSAPPSLLAIPQRDRARPRPGQPPGGAGPVRQPDGGRARGTPPFPGALPAAARRVPRDVYPPVRRAGTRGTGVRERRGRHGTPARRPDSAMSLMPP